MNVLALDHKSDSGDARKALDRAATAAARRILQKSGRTVTQLAAAMCYTSRSLDEFLSGRIHWGAQSIAALAAATDQHPVEMLAREVGSEPVSLLPPSGDEVEAKIRDALRSYECRHWYYDDGSPSRLVDWLSDRCDIRKAREELDELAEHITTALLDNEGEP